jgi:hypothetical protein
VDQGAIFRQVHEPGRMESADFIDITGTSRSINGEHIPVTSPGSSAVSTGDAILWP